MNYKLLFILILFLSGCISYREEESLKKLTGFLNAEVSLKKGYKTGTDGSYKLWEIEIQDLKINQEFKESNLESATSLASMILYKELGREELEGYKLIKVTIIDKQETFSREYLIEDLELVDKGFERFENFLLGIKDLNSELFISNTDNTLFNSFPIEIFFNTLNELNTSIGPIEDIEIKGFKIINENDTKIVNYWATLLRPNFPNRIDVQVDTETNLIVKFDM